MPACLLVDHSVDALAFSQFAAVCGLGESAGKLRNVGAEALELGVGDVYVSTMREFLELARGICVQAFIDKEDAVRSFFV